jgi:hypothetical protein
VRLPLRFLPLLLALPLGAQGFEGTMSMRISAPDGTLMDVKYLIKGDKMGMTMTAPASTGPMAGAEIRMIIDQGAKTATMLMPAPAGMTNMLPPDTKGIKMVTPIAAEAASAGGAAAVTYKKLGTSQTIAGLKCDDYEATTDGQTIRSCLASNVGMFSYPNLGGGMGGRGGRGAAAPAWSKGIGQAPGFPLKVWSTDNKVAMEVTAIDRAAVPASAFEVPAGYMDLGGAMGGRRP